MKLLITGGAGYIGTELIYLLNKEAAVSEIVVYDNLSRSNRNFFIGVQKLNPNKIRFVEGDILDTRKLRETMAGVEVVYHLAADVSTPFADRHPHLFEQVNHWGTAEVVYAVEATPSVRRLIYTGSASSYGASDSPFTIDSIPQPKTFYGISKFRGEKHVQRMIPKLEKVFVLRCGNVYGYSKSMRFDAVINKFMFQANYNRLIHIDGNGKQHRPFISIQKIATVLSRLITSELQSGIYNAVDKNPAIGEIVEVLRKIYPELEMIFVNQSMDMRNLQVEPSPEIQALFPEIEENLEEELLRFKEAFVFG